MSAAALGVIFLLFPLHILLPVRMLNVVLSPPINYILIGGESFARLPRPPSQSVGIQYSCIAARLRVLHVRPPADY